ncbi:hypothetical protein GCM10010365_47920 [Streptomyces poonensis]|uniref:Uncharacterized protein n=2 Tax=Streptomyces poonensis TaxID=68255 RepID=A0A918PVM6_9ACTN|nr:hypothetical protein GCM10010365_47920 [Streptomyces poonensis]GLJ93357.1 hypothetical protein GCM10017589_59690 [Streptomyces poonensis]
MALAIVMTPFLLQWAAPAEEDWDRLSKISQAYGALSVLFSAAALLGVVASLVHQSHQTDIANEEAQRASHRQLLLASLDDPELALCWEPLPDLVSFRERKQVAFVNLIVSNWWADYRLKRTNDDVVRVLTELHFRGEAARRHWHLTSAYWNAYAVALGDRRFIKFVALMDAAYEQAVATGPPLPSASRHSTDG